MTVRKLLRSFFAMFSSTGQQDAPARLDMNELADLATRTEEGDSDARSKLEEAMTIVRRDAEKGDAQCQYLLANFYFNGYLWPQDLEKAVQWAQKAAAQGHAEAQYELGVAYEKGEKVLQEYTTAAALYRKSAGQGFHWAQNNLALLYESGSGVEQDYEEAERLYELAADQGNPFAFCNLNNLKILRISGTGHRIRKAREFAAPVKIGLYCDGRATFNGADVTQETLEAKCYEAAKEGRGVFVYLQAAAAEGATVQLDSPNAKESLNRLPFQRANLRIAFAGDEHFGRAPLPAEYVPPKLSNLVLYQPLSEYESRIGNGREMLNYLNNLDLALASAEPRVENVYVTVALRPNQAKFWVWPLRDSNADKMDPVIRHLESLPPPTVKSGVVSFGFAHPGEPGLWQKDSRFPIPLSWQEVGLRLGSVTTSMILDDLWPPDGTDAKY